MIYTPMSEFSVEQLKSFLDDTGINCVISGEMKRVFSHPASLSNADEGSLTFIRSAEVKLDLSVGLRGIILCPPKLHNSNIEKAIENGDLTKIVIDETEVVFYLILNHFFSERLPEAIHESSYVESGAAIDHGVTVGANSFVASSVSLEYGVRIGSNCTLRNCSVGAETIIQDGVRIGEEALGAVQRKNGEWIDRQSFGRVVIGRNVRIEANTVIYRGFLTDTIVNNNIRIGSNCSIGNGVQIGEGTLIALGVVICGSVSIGSNARIWGNSSMREGITIGNQAVVGLGAVVLNDVKDGDVHVGNPSKRL